MAIKWLYQNGLKPVAELDSLDHVTARYVYGSRADVPDYMIKGGKTYRLITDHLGSVRLVVRADSGMVAEKLSYDSWGRVISDTSPGFTSFGFAGGLYDPDTRLVRFGLRDYDAGIGRWTCKDPIGFSGGAVSLMAYAAGDPVDLSDPHGTSAQDDQDNINFDAGSADRFTCGLTARIRNRFFSYNDIDIRSREYRDGQRVGRDILYNVLLSAGCGFVGSSLELLGEAASSAALSESGIGSTVEDILADSTPGKVDQVIQFAKPGGMGAAEQDFSRLTRGVEVLERPGGLRTATLLTAA